MRKFAKMFADRGLSAKVTMMIVLGLVVLSVSSFIAARTLLRDDAQAQGLARQETHMRVAWDVLGQYGKGYRIQDDALFLGDRKLDDFNEPVDRIKRLVGGTATIFKGDTRVASNVMTDEGKRAVGTKLAAGPARDAVLGRGAPYRGRADILGKPYFTAYDPIKDANGKVIGVLYVGIPADEFMASVRAVEGSLAIVGAIVTLIAAAICMWLARGMFRPLEGMGAAMQDLASGRYDIVIPGRDRADEVGRMAGALEVFRLAGLAKEEGEADARRRQADRDLVVAQLENSLRAVSEADLTADLTGAFPEDFIALKDNFNTTLATLRELIGAVAESAHTIHTGSNEIAQASEDLARRTEGNAASLEQTSAAIAQMDARLKATAQAAVSTVERADGAIAVVGTGRAIAGEAVDAMERVSESAKGIDSVIEGLDKIAFQTRVLAMNAAVEAGRAGDAGRGFAVVADLVSALAMRSEEEAKRAREQLSATQHDIIAAVGAVERVDGALADIVGDVSEVHRLLGSISTDNQTQSSAITQISVAIGTMDQSTQQNAAMVEQTSAAARNLTAEVMSLAEQAARFNTGRAQGAPVSRARAMAMTA